MPGVVYSLLTSRGMGSLKHLKDIELFKEQKIILVKGFIVELMIAARPPYPLSFRHLEDINQCNWDVEKII